MNYKTLMLLPIAIFILAVGYVAWAGYTGNIKLDIDLKGGTQVVLESADELNAKNIESALSGFNARVRTAKGVSGWSTIINLAEGTDSKEILSALDKAGIPYSGYSVQTIGSELGKTFFSQAQFVLVIAFALMAATIFIIFRVPIPSLYVVLAGFADIVEAFAVSQIFGIELSLATFAALLLLIGYSVDTNILLTARVLKDSGEFSEKVRNSRKTGLTMTAAAVASMVALFLMGSSTVLSQIASVLVIGLIADVMNTWILNVGLLKIYFEKKGAL